MSVRSFRGAVEWALMVGLVFGAGAIAQAQQEEEQPNDRVIQIGRADQEAANVDGGVAPLNRPTDGAIAQQEIPEVLDRAAWRRDWRRRSVACACRFAGEPGFVGA